MSTILVKVTKSIAKLKRTPTQATERAWRIDDKKVSGIDTVVAVCNAKIVEVFQVNSYNKIQTGSDAGKYEFDLTVLVGPTRSSLCAGILSNPQKYLSCRNIVVYYP